MRTQVANRDTLPRLQQNATVKLARYRHRGLPSLKSVRESNFGPDEAAPLNCAFHDLAFNQNTPHLHMLVGLRPTKTMETPHHQDGTKANRRKPKSVVHAF